MDGVALLNRWLAETEMRPADLARALGVSPASVSLWRSGKRSPDRRSANEIERLTKHRVPATSWDRDPPPQPSHA